MRLLASLMRRYGQKVMMVRKISQLYAQERCCHFTSRDLMEIVRRAKVKDNYMCRRVGMEECGRLVINVTF